MYPSTHKASFTQFYTPTLGLSLEKKVIKINGQEINVCIWDTAGQEKFFSLTKNYFKKADGVLVVFDLTDKMSFDSTLPPIQESINFGYPKSKKNQMKTADKFW